MNDIFEPVADAVESAYLAAWDGCHKIYLAMDETEAAWFRENYENVYAGKPHEMLSTVIDWFNQSCGLRFVNAVRHDEVDPNSGFSDLISQFALEDDGEPDDEDEDY
jgi:hypothetical protein